MTRVWLIRHGESEANAGLSTTIPSTVGLTEAGWQQARQVSHAFEGAPALIITSSYLRAIQTAQPTMERFPNIQIETWDIQEFTYLSPKKLGKTSKIERQPRVQSFWESCDPTYLDGEDAESFSGFMHRIKIMREKLLARNNDFMAVFCHGFVIKAMLWANLLNSFTVTSDYMRNFYMFHNSFSLHNGSIVEGEFNSRNSLFSGMITGHLMHE